jgi:hypothetical protein
MLRVGFEPKIPASKRAKTVHALDHSATVTGERYMGNRIIVQISHNPELDGGKW